MVSMEKFRFYAFKLTGVLILVFILQMLIPGFTEFFLLDSSKLLEVWRFLTSIFLHAGVTHILYNGFALLLFGSILERLIGERKFLIVFFSTGVLANIVSVWFYPSSLGASGAIFGVIGALIVVRPLMTVWAFGLPMPIFVAGILWVAGDVLGAVGFLVGNPINNTGNIAHLSGIFIGFIFGFFYRKRKERGRENTLRFAEGSVRNWEDSWMR